MAKSEDGEGSWAVTGLFERTYRGTPIYIIALTLIIPYLIVHLALRPTLSGSRAYRLALAPVALWAMWVMYDTYIMLKREFHSSSWALGLRLG